MKKVPLWSTSLYIKGKDVDTGKTVSRKLYRDDDGNRYVRLGSYGLYAPNAFIDLGYFTEHCICDYKYV